MVIPRFTLLWLLILVTASAGVSFVLSFAHQGHAWALGILAGMASLVGVLLLHAAAFSVAWIYTQLGYMFRGPEIVRGNSPFKPGTKLPEVPSQVVDPEPPAIMS
ncbi:MAG: hypothetical protein MUF06_15295 [Pirellulaceae bacterium]|jgi:hypothetical protein|nr:hypothetical protein [Pirellulaceae bacterium]